MRTVKGMGWVFTQNSTTDTNETRLCVSDCKFLISKQISKLYDSANTKYTVAKRGWCNSSVDKRYFVYSK